MTKSQSRTHLRHRYQLVSEEEAGDVARSSGSNFGGPFPGSCAWRARSSQLPSSKQSQAKSSHPAESHSREWPIGPSHLLPAPDSLLRILSFMQIKQRQQHRQLREFLAYFMGPAHCQLLFDAVMPIETVAIIAIV